jgi:hypothetical protein
LNLLLAVCHEEMFLREHRGDPSSDHPLIKERISWLVNQTMLHFIDVTVLTIITVNVWFISYLHLTTNAAEKERKKEVKGQLLDYHSNHTPNYV